MLLPWWPGPESLPACPVFIPVCILGPAVSPAGWIVRPVLYNLDQFYGRASFRLNFFELFLSSNSDIKLREEPPRCHFPRAWRFLDFPLSPPAAAGGGDGRSLAGPAGLLSRLH